MVARGGGWEVGEVVKGVKRYKLQVIKKRLSPSDAMYSMVTTVSNTVLTPPCVKETARGKPLYSTGGSAQCSVTA